MDYTANVSISLHKNSNMSERLNIWSGRLVSSAIPSSSMIGKSPVVLRAGVNSV